MNGTPAATEKQVAFATRLAGQVQATSEERAAILARIPELTRAEASELIDTLLAMPKPAKAEMPEGIYLLAGTVYKVQRAKGSGRVYALALTDGEFTYDRGAIFTLATAGATPITLDQAIAYGLRTGRCCCCGHALTQQDSLRAGVGPVCAQRHFGATPKQLRLRAQAAAAVAA